MTTDPFSAFDPPDIVSFESGYRAAARPLMFETGNADYPVASYGGTITLLEFEGEIFAVTCAHEFGDFDWQRTIITQSLHGGGPPAPILSIFELSDPIHDAIGSDLLDIVVLQFSRNIDREWFVDKPKLIDDQSIAECATGELLCAIGSVAHLSRYDRQTEFAQGELHVHAQPRMLTDGTLRQASAFVATDALSSLNGMSGGPVFRINDHKFCGIIVRGGINSDELANIYFVEASDILQVLRATRTPGRYHAYEKHIKINSKND